MEHEVIFDHISNDAHAAATIAYLGIGSSLGDRFGNLRLAVSRLNRLNPLVEVLASSGVYESPHLGLSPEDARRLPPHLNAALKIRTQLTPHELLTRIQEIETVGGRTRETRWSPRTIDIDILLFGDYVTKTDDLQTPHPRMTNRAFVIVPLYELEPDLTFPDGTTVKEIYRSTEIQAQSIEQVSAASELLL